MNKLIRKIFGHRAVFVGRCYTRDGAAFTYRMGAGFPGDINRTHPVSIEPALIDGTNPPAAYGNPVLLDASSHKMRGFIATDNNASATNAYGFLVRPYPSQASSATNFGASAFGAAAPPTSGVGDVCRYGYILAQLNSGAAAPVKDGQVFVWCAATTTGHVQGQLESAASTGNTVPLSNATFNGPADASGVVEVVMHQ